VGSAVSLGLAVEGVTTLMVDTMRPPAGAAPDLGGPFYLLLGGTLAGLTVAGFLAWRLLAPLESVYRRGGLALVSAFGTVLVMLVCIPINQTLGRAGLLGLIAISLAISVLLARRARRAGPG
jgi:hypothetical protein